MAGLRRGYRKPVKTGKPGIADAIKPGSIDDLMQRHNETIRRAKKERQTTRMLFEATVQINDETELDVFASFLAAIADYRKDPFAITPEVAKKTEAAMKFDELVPADDPPEATAGPTWATVAAMQEARTGNLEKFATVDALMVDLNTPTEDDAVAAFKKFAASHKPEESVALVKSFNVARVKELDPSARARFIAECSRAS